MSVGHFEYNQRRIDYIADEIDNLIKTNDSDESDDLGCPIGLHYSKETIDKFNESLVTLRKAAIMAHRVDLLVSGDNAESSFHRHWEEDLVDIEG